MVNTSLNNTAGGGSSSNRPAQKQDRLVELASRLKTAENVNPDFADFLLKYWRQIAWIVVGTVSVVWVVMSFRSAQDLKLKESSARFDAVASLYKGLSGITLPEDSSEQIDSGQMEKIDLADPKKKEEATSRFVSQVEQIGANFGTSFYSKAAELYLALNYLNSGDVAKSKSLLDKLGAQKLLGHGVVSGEGSLSAENKARENRSDEDFLEELASLVYVRASLQGGVGEKEIELKNTARKQLQSLARNALHVNSEAVILLSRLAENQAQKDEAKKIAETLIASRPELADSLIQELQQIGIALKRESKIS